MRHITETEPRATTPEHKLPCQWEAPVPEWLWAWAGIVKVEKEKDENGGDTGRAAGLGKKEDT